MTARSKQFFVLFFEMYLFFFFFFLFLKKVFLAVLRAWPRTDSDRAWPCHGHSLVFHVRLVSKLLPAKAVIFVAEMFRKGNAVVIFEGGKAELLKVCFSNVSCITAAKTLVQSKVLAFIWQHCISPVCKIWLMSWIVFTFVCALSCYNEVDSFQHNVPFYSFETISCSPLV